MVKIPPKIIFLLMALVFMLGIVYSANIVVSTGIKGDRPRAVISLGQDLTPAQKDEVMKVFAAWEKGKEIRFVEVSNEEERQYLEGIVDERIIGTRAISSAYCELLDKGKGIEVQTENITAITPFMYANALATAGIEDARVVVSAPVKVSGTAALTGIIKAFETVSGDKLQENAKYVAHEEMAGTSELGKNIGADNAGKIIFEVKKRVLAQDISSPEEIEKIVYDVSGELNIELSQADRELIVNLMQKIQQLDLSAGQLGNQLQNLNRELDELENTGQEAVSLLNQIVAVLRDLVTSLKNLVGAV